jgi:hypothetical protein
MNSINLLNPATFIEPVPNRTWISIVIYHFIYCGDGVKMRGDSLFCWYRWNYFPSLLKLSLFCWYWCNYWPSLFKPSLFCWYWCNCWPSLSKPFIISDHAFPSVQLYLFTLQCHLLSNHRYVFYMLTKVQNLPRKHFFII